MNLDNLKKKLIPKFTYPQIVFFLLLALIWVYFFYKGHDLQQGLEKRGRYTIGKVVDIETYGTKSGYEHTFIIEYIVNKKKYEGGQGFHTHEVRHDYSIGDSVFVHFVSNEPNKEIVLINKPSIENVGKIPPKGWEEFPDSLTKPVPDPKPWYERWF